MKKHTETIIYSYDEIDEVAKRVRALFPYCHVFTLVGSLGAGKTSLIQAILRQCGVTGPIISPTFVYVQTYQVGDRHYHHFDLYRITSVDDFFSSGFEEYLHNPNDIVFIEWPEIMHSILNKGKCSIAIDYKGSDKRQATIEWVQGKNT